MAQPVNLQHRAERHGPHAERRALQQEEGDQFGVFGAAQSRQHWRSRHGRTADSKPAPGLKSGEAVTRFRFAARARGVEFLRTTMATPLVGVIMGSTSD